MPEAEIARQAGIEQAFPIYAKPAHMRWGREALQGLAYISTGRRPLECWLWVIGRAED